MNGLVMAGQLLLAFSILVIIHELGHYLAARAFGIRVEKFYIFFDAGAKLWSKKIGETEFGIGWLPLGGYVKISGMIDESLDTKSLKKEPEAWEFRSKPAWQKLIVMVAGVVMNIILGVTILTFVHLKYTKEYLPIESVKEGIYAYPYARFLGFETGDKVVAINGKAIERYEDVFSTKLFFAKNVQVNRNGELLVLEMTDTLFSYLKNNGLFIGLENHPFAIDEVVEDYYAYKAGIRPGDKVLQIDNIRTTTFGALREALYLNSGDTIMMIVDKNISIDTLMVPVDDEGRIGVMINKPQYEYQKYNLFSAMKYGWRDAVESLTANIKGFSLIFKGKEKARDNLAGPIGIAKIYGGVWDWGKFWNITAILSMILALVNILPIPALDGGHVFLLSIEAITGKKLPDKAMEVIQIIGMVLVFSLMIFVIGNDIINLFR